MRIPKQFQLGGYTITVENNERMYFDKGYDGEVDYSKQLITLQPPTKAYPIKDQYHEQIFCHELVHYLLKLCQEDGQNLNDNERFVDRMSVFLHQALSTMEYEEDGI